MHFQRRNGRRVLRADHGHITVIERMRLDVIVQHLGEIFSGHAHLDGKIVVSRGQDDRLCPVLATPPPPVHRTDEKAAAGAFDVVDALVLPNIKLVVFSHPPVVLERLRSIGFVADRRHGQIADFEQFRRRKEGHVRGVVVERVHHATLVENDRRNP